MGILDKPLGGNAITANTICAEIARAEAEIVTHRTNLTDAMMDVATLTDAEHIKVEADVAALHRVIARCEPRASNLLAELPAVIATEAAQKANDKEAAKLLAE